MEHGRAVAGGRFGRRMVTVEDDFDAAFRRRAPRLDVRAETGDDVAFLTRLHAECSPLAGLVPGAMMLQQAEFARSAHNRAFPRATHRIATLDGAPIGRFMIDWSGPDSWGVDLAVLPDFRAGGAGLHFLRAWVEAADRHGRPAGLSVQRSNPARHIYARLGFVDAMRDGDPASIVMRREPRRGS